jgi:hypothetical protein
LRDDIGPNGIVPGATLLSFPGEGSTPTICRIENLPHLSFNWPGMGWYHMTTDAPAYSSTRIVLGIRFNTNGISWCSSVNPARTVHNLYCGVYMDDCRNVLEICTDYCAELYELRFYNGSLSNTQMQNTVSELALKWPAIVP